MKIKTIIYDTSKGNKVIENGASVRFLIAGEGQEWIKAKVESYNEYGITFRDSDDEELEVEYNELVDIQLIS